MFFENMIHTSLCLKYIYLIKNKQQHLNISNYPICKFVIKYIEKEKDREIERGVYEICKYI